MSKKNFILGIGVPHTRNILTAIKLQEITPLSLYL